MIGLRKERDVLHFYAIKHGHACACAKQQLEFSHTVYTVLFSRTGETLLKIVLGDYFLRQYEFENKVCLLLFMNQISQIMKYGV